MSLESSELVNQVNGEDVCFFALGFSKLSRKGESPSPFTSHARYSAREEKEWSITLNRDGKSMERDARIPDAFL